MLDTILIISHIWLINWYIWSLWNRFYQLCLKADQMYREELKDVDYADACISTTVNDISVL